MQTAFLLIQCKTPDQSEVGTFIAQGNRAQSWATCTLASPVFPDLASLAPWLRENGWDPLPYDANWPVGRYSKCEKLGA